jgi:hypothetical protein
MWAREVAAAPASVPAVWLARLVSQWLLPPSTRCCCGACLVQVEAIEKVIGAGQVEELIEQAKDELELIPQYAGTVCPSI